MAVNLNDLLPDARFVNLGKGEVEVMSLDVTHIGVLLEKYGLELEGLFAQDSKPDFTALAKSMPAVINDIVAMGIRAEDQFEAITRIPLSAKVEVLSAIWELSVTDPKKLMATLKNLAEGAKALRVQAGA